MIVYRLVYIPFYELWANFRGTVHIIGYIIQCIRPWSYIIVMLQSTQMAFSEFSKGLVLLHLLLTAILISSCQSHLPIPSLFQGSDLVIQYEWNPISAWHQPWTFPFFSSSRMACIMSLGLLGYATHCITSPSQPHSFVHLMNVIPSSSLP